MKEFTIEEKAKRYDEAIKKAKYYYDEGKTLEYANDIVSDIFPELKEREDEKIRESLLEYLHTLPNHYTHDGVCVLEWIAWLEKQGEQNPYSGVSFNYNGHTWGMCARDNGVDILLDKQLFKHLEKQGEQKTVIKGTFVNVDEVREDFMQEVYRILDADPTNDRANQIIDAFDHLPTIIGDNVESTNYNSIAPHFGKPIDKVEPKFNVGDWVVDEDDNRVYQIERVIENVTSGKYAYDLMGGCYFPSTKKNYHLWTIQDAKDGDVLALYYASQNYILIYKRLHKKNFETIMSVFCFYCVKEDTYYTETDNFHFMNCGEIITPATKEQRDTLFAKMKEAGHEWDAEKKQLKWRLNN